MSEYIKISDIMKIYKSLYNGYGTTASFNVPVFIDLLRTVAVELPEPPKVEELREERDELQKELARYKWVSVKDRLPEKSVPVLICAAGHRVTAYYDKVKEVFRLTEDDNLYYLTKYVAHWMPLPEPPESEGEICTVG